MSPLRHMLSAQDAVALTALASPGLLRRAQAALAAPGAVGRAEESSEAAMLRIGDFRVNLGAYGPA
ncbi:MAG: hypothetical protein P8X69_08915 [Maritimibacter sp.]